MRGERQDVTQRAQLIFLLRYLGRVLAKGGLSRGNRPTDAAQSIHSGAQVVTGLRKYPLLVRIRPSLLAERPHLPLTQISPLHRSLTPPKPSPRMIEDMS